MNQTHPVPPAHMTEDAEYFDHWAPQFYAEAECTFCNKPIYRYQMDLVVEWKHFNHATYCDIRRARPKAVSDPNGTL